MWTCHVWDGDSYEDISDLGRRQLCRHVRFRRETVMWTRQI